jgi:hypothetical protein
MLLIRGWKKKALLLPVLLTPTSSAKIGGLEKALFFLI